jgi:hypothetical protein
MRFCLFIFCFFVGVSSVDLMRLKEYFIQRTDSAASAMITEKQPALSNASMNMCGIRKSFAMAVETAVLLAWNAKSITDILKKSMSNLRLKPRSVSRSKTGVVSAAIINVCHHGSSARLTQQSMTQINSRSRCLIGEPQDVTSPG